MKGDNARIDKYDFLARSFMPDDTTEVAGGVVLSNFIGVKNGGNIQAGITGGTYRAGEELKRVPLLFARDSHTVGTTPHPQYVSTSIAADETDHRNIPTAQAVKQYVASRLPEAGEWYNIHTYKCDPHLSTVIETASVTPAMMDTSQYRLVLYRFRKHASEGRRWRIPMLPYEHQLRINPRAEVHSAIPYNRTFWQITGTTVPWWNGQAELKDVLSLTANASYQRCRTQTTSRCASVSPSASTPAKAPDWAGSASPTLRR